MSHAVIRSVIYDLSCYRVPETIPSEILGKMNAPAKPAFKVMDNHDLANYDAYLFGIPTRYGNMPAQWKVRRKYPLPSLLSVILIFRVK